MPICVWSDDYVSGILDVDAQHKTLFQIINAFAVDENVNVPTSVFLAFLDYLGAYCDTHFALEESMMAQHNYPLAEYHTTAHANLKKTVSEIREKVASNSLGMPYRSITDLATEWLNNHIAKDDLAFFGFCKTKKPGTSIGEDFVNAECDILTMNNTLLGIGKINSISPGDVVITYLPTDDTPAMPIQLNDILKISSYTPKGENRIFVAKVYHSDRGIIRLFNATISPVIHNRKHFRIPVKQPASLYIDDELYIIIITDISAGGLQLESTHLMELNDIVTIKFLVENNSFSEQCRIMWIEERDDFFNNYGVEFISMSSSNTDKINSFVFNSQVLAKTNAGAAYKNV